MYFDKFALSRRGFLGRSLLGVTAATGAGLALPGLARADTTLERAKSAGFVRVGFANEAPFGYADARRQADRRGAGGRQGRPRQKMGIAQVDGVLTEFGSLIPGLKAGRFDIIAAGMFVNPERCARDRLLRALLRHRPGDPRSRRAIPEGHRRLRVLRRQSPTSSSRSWPARSRGGYAKDAGVELRPGRQPPRPGEPRRRGAGRARRRRRAHRPLDRRHGREGRRASKSTKPFSEVAGKSVKGHGAFGFRKEDTGFPSTPSTPS